MVDKKLQKQRSNVFLTILLVLLLVSVLLIGGYFLYENLPGNPESSKAIIESPPKLEVGNLSYKIRQFYPNMKFNHNAISYNIDPACTEEKRTRMIEAFDELSAKVGILSFFGVVADYDIEVNCSESSKPSPKEDFFIAGEGGAREIIQTERYNVITEGVILLHSNPHNFYKCEWPNIELHELLHVFGFDHSQNENSLMYSYLESCEQKLDESIINDLKKLYSQENLADLYFENITGIKKGRYLDFNASIKNSGTINAENVFLSVFDGNNRLENFGLKDIPFGAGVDFNVQNLKLKSRSSKNVRIVIDQNNSIIEIDKENNIAELKF